jgi:hypothetical protein
MNKEKLLKHLIGELNTMDLVAEEEGFGKLISIRFKNKNLTNQDRGVMEVFKYADDASGYVRWGGYQKQLNKFELMLLMGIVSANHHRILYF